MLGRFFHRGKFRPGFLFPRGKIYTGILFPGAIRSRGGFSEGKFNAGGNSMLQHRDIEDNVAQWFRRWTVPLRAHRVFVMHGGSIPQCETFFLGFPLVSYFGQVFEMLFVLISLSKRFNFI